MSMSVLSNLFCTQRKHFTKQKQVSFVRCCVIYSYIKILVKLQRFRNENELDDILTVNLLPGKLRGGLN